MKRILILIVVSVLLISSSALAETFDLTGMTDDQLRDLRTAIDVELSSRQAARTLSEGILAEGTLGDAHIAVLSVEKTKDYKDEPALLITYLFTYNGDGDSMFMTEVTDKVFQDGVALESAMSVDGYNAMTQMTSVKNGASLEVTAAYILRNTNSPVEIEIGKFIDFSSNPEKIIVTVAIQ